jgi:multicomponent Na+:H+ antiporter subunit G
MIGLVVDIVSWALLLAGGAFCIIGMIGLHRMPDLYTRMHAASVTESLGAILMTLGMVVQAGFTLLALKLIVILLLILLVGPAVTHALAKAALARGLTPVLADKGGESSQR